MTDKMFLCTLQEGSIIDEGGAEEAVDRTREADSVSMVYFEEMSRGSPTCMLNEVFDIGWPRVISYNSAHYIRYLDLF